MAGQGACGTLPPSRGTRDRSARIDLLQNSTATSGEAAYGGVYGGWTLLLDHSRVCNNQGLSGAGFTPRLTARYSTVSHNVGGRLEMQGGVVHSSTFSHNDGYGLYLWRGRVMNSTFSSNRGPGVYASRGGFWQNTVAYNTIPRVQGVCFGGLSTGNGWVQLRGNIIANNTCDGVPLDLRARRTRIYLPSSRNLIMTRQLGPETTGFPPDTLTADPRLLPLANNGGPTRTHALRPDSPALNRGSSTDVGLFDQRGPGFPRQSGFRDIGAYELQPR